MADLHDEKIPVGTVSCHFDVPQEFFRLRIELLLEILQVVLPLYRQHGKSILNKTKETMCVFVCVHIKHRKNN